MSQTTAPLTFEVTRRTDLRPDAEREAVLVNPGFGTTFTELGSERVKVLDALVAHDAPRLDPGRIELRGGRVLIGTASDPLELVTVHPAGRRRRPRWKTFSP